MVPRLLRQEFPYRARVRAITPYGVAAPIGKVFLFARRKGEDGGLSASPFPIEVLAVESSVTRIFQFTEAEVDLLAAEDEAVAA